MKGRSAAFGPVPQLSCAGGRCSDGVCCEGTGTAAAPGPFWEGGNRVGTVGRRRGLAAEVIKRSHPLYLHFLSVNTESDTFVAHQGSVKIGRLDGCTQ